ncbi:MAG: hypothetical protein K6B28_04285 [Lachnospiraceae bacterium]|nr:hypothetical protein [Lachnospiraceae bacterium]
MSDIKEERRQIQRVKYPTRSVLVDCESQERYYVKTENVSPLGMGIVADGSIPNLVGRDVIVVAETMVMYADVNRQEKREDGRYILGVSARRFSDDVLRYLFEHIAGADLDEAEK